MMLLTGLTLVWAACTTGSALNPENVEITVSISGSGVVYSPTSQVGLSCRNSCSHGFFDSGSGGVFDVVAVPDPGWRLVSWGGDCASAPDLTCTLSFTTLPAEFNVDAVFEEVPDDIVLSDDFDSPSGCDDWTTTTGTGGVAGESFQACRPNGGSDSGAYREMTHELPGEGTLVADHQYLGGTVLVGTGVGEAVCAVSVTFREQRALTSPAFDGAAVGASVWVLQDGVRYRASLGQFTETTWTSFDSGALTADDFAPAGLDLCPSTPTPLAFGYTRSNTNTNGSVPQVNVHGIDEWSVTIRVGG